MGKVTRQFQRKGTMTSVIPGQSDHRRRDWLQASVQVTRCLLSATGKDPLRVVARAVNQVAQADLTLVVLPAAAGGPAVVEVAVGEGTEEMIGHVFDVEGPVTSDVIRTGIEVGPLMVVPLVGDRGARGAMAIARQCGGRPFDSEDRELATSFADYAAIALELADARADHQRMTLLEDRQRIAAELHDHVLQRLFASGMSMQAMAAAVGPPYSERLEQLIDETDDTIARIRAVIHDLNEFRSP